MPIRLSNAFISTSKPGAYFSQRVTSEPTGVAVSGNIFLIGEAETGLSQDLEAIKDNFFGPDQLGEVINKYKSGPIVEAFRALSTASADADIVGAPTRIYIAKTNVGTQASAIVAPTYGTLKDQNYGTPGNLLNYIISQAQSEVAASVTGDSLTIGDGSLFNGLTFSIRANGGAVTVITLSGVSADHDTIAELAAEINGQLPVGMQCTFTGTQLIIRFTAVSDATANALGFGKSFELIDSDPGDLAAIGFDAGLYTSASEPEVQIDVRRTVDNTNEQFLAKAQVALEIGYQGTTATATISASRILTTTVTGGSGANLTINLAQYTTVKDLADFIASQTGYSASANQSSTQSPTSVLDVVSAVGIASTASSLKPGRIKKANANFKAQLANSSKISFTSTATAGLPSPMTGVAFLSGGAKGSTTGASVVASLTKAETVNVNFVIPLFSRDATADIAEGLTESGSTYTISAVNASAKSHVLKMSTPKVKKHRQAFCSIWDTFANTQGQASSLANFRVSLAFQKSSQVDVAGNVVSFYPWHSACIAAGMQAAGFYKAIFNKFANVISFEDPAGFDSGSLTDVETALESGLLMFEKGAVGSKWVSDQTTYGFDTNFVYNSIQAVYAADLVSLDLADSVNTAFIGKSVADVDRGVVESFVASKMAAYRANKLISASDDAPLGFRDLDVKIKAPTISLAVNVKLSSSLYFSSIDLLFSQVTREA